ncbi:MAG: 3-oxoacyl-ACP reductase [Rhodospirillales bacterium]|nr:3-oxoacyl-ACP reductase [Rhodospirillales bacterium]
MNDRVVLVTGGTRGIGRAIADRFCEQGATVIVCGRSAPREKLPTRAGFISCDIADAGAVKQMFAAITQLDILVNNAGLAGGNPLDGDDDLWHAIVATNLHGAYYCSKAALPLLPDKKGRIINIASVLGLYGVGDSTAYCAAKHGVVGLTRALAKAVAPRGITVNAVCPGFVRTDMAEQRYQEIGITEAQAAAAAPTGRITEPSEVAGAVLWFASADAGNVTGQALVMDGGRMG